MGLSFTSSGVPIYEPDGRVLSDFFWDRSDLSVIQGPIGSGTSSACCHKLWALATDQAADIDGVRRTRWLIVRSTYPELEQTTVRTWLDWFPEDKFGVMLRSKPMRHLIQTDHPSGDGTRVHAEFVFIAIPDPETAEQVAASFEITGFWLNEAQFHEKKTVTELLSRCGRYPSPMRGSGATWSGGVLDMNAPVAGHWVPYMRGDIPFPEEWTDDQRREHTKPDEWSFFLQPAGLIERMVDGKVVYEENPQAENQKWLKRGYYLNKAQVNSKAWIDRRVMNKTGLYSDGQPVYPTFSESDHVSKYPLSTIEGARVIVGLDFGRQPAAVWGHCVNDEWKVLGELWAENEPAVKFAPRLKKKLAQLFPNGEFLFGGDPAGDRPDQNDDRTAFDIFMAHGMRVIGATTDNNLELRRSTLTAVMSRRSGLLIDPKCSLVKAGLAGGYHHKKIKGTAGLYSQQAVKNRYSHVIEALENMVLIGGEGDAVVRGPSNAPKPVPTKRREKRMRGRKRQ